MAEVEEEVNPMHLRLTVNGVRHELHITSSRTLADVLRNDLGLMGVKISCDSGECGSCTVLMNDKAVTSCLVLAVDAANKDIVTVEGLARDGELDPIQKAFVENDAIQCGFCTPGMIMSVKALMNKNPTPSKEEIRETLSGVLCRCTGYVNAIRSVESLSQGSERRLAAETKE
jgi:aerobic-type carbon monoxide dehydrogenase small subunit (CoxS/CutS family)